MKEQKQPYSNKTIGTIDALIGLLMFTSGIVLIVFFLTWSLKALGFFFALLVISFMLGVTNSVMKDENKEYFESINPPKQNIDSKFKKKLRDAMEKSMEQHNTKNVK